MPTAFITGAGDIEAPIMPGRVGDVLQALLDAAGVQAEVQTDADLAKRLLGWVPAIPWTQTIGDVLADWKARILV